jgi:hypothetical protein
VTGGVPHRSQRAAVAPDPVILVALAILLLETHWFLGGGAD